MKDEFSGKLPLPSSSSKEDLETISRNKFSMLFSTTLFEIRQENQKDKGIDLTIEIKKDGSYTNFRFAVQIKSTESIKPNKDGSISFPVEVSNINYLLNNGMPAYYVLYDHNSEKFYLEDVNQVYYGLIKKHNPKNIPEKVKVRFSKLLSPVLITEIYNHTFDNGTLLRRLNSHLKFPNTKLAKGIVIDGDNEVYSVEQNVAFINQFGFMLLNNADFDRVIEIEQRTHPRTEASATFNLVCGIAYFQRANLFKALELLKAAQHKSAEFTADIQSMLSYTLLHAKYLLGMIGKPDFQQELGKLMNGDDLGSFLQVEKAYKVFVRREEKDADGLQTLYKTLHQIILKESDSNSLRVIAYAQILSAESKILINDLTMNFFQICGRVNDLLKTNTYKQWDILAKIFEKRLDSVIEFALSQKNFMAVSNLSSTKVDWIYEKTYIRHLLKNWNKTAFDLDKPLDKEDLDILLKYSVKLDKIAETYEMLQHKENLVLCLSRKYELLHFAGQKKDANLLAKRILEIIEANDLNGLKAQYRELINGETSHEKFIQKFTDHLAQIHSVAKKCGIEDGHIYGEIPKSVLAFMEKDIKWSIKTFYEFNFPSNP